MVTNFLLAQDDVNLLIQMPDYPSKPAWGCDGTEFNLEVPLTLLVGTLRDRIAVRFCCLLSSAFIVLISSSLQAKRGLPISKQKLTYNGRVLTNSATLQVSISRTVISFRSLSKRRSSITAVHFVPQPGCSCAILVYSQARLQE